MRYERAALSILVALAVFAFPVHAALRVGPNIDIAGETSPDRQQAEPTIAVDPNNPNILVAGAQDLRLIPQGGHRWHGYYRSTDRGKSWSSALVPGFPGDTSADGMSSPLHGFGFTTDPVLAFDGAGNVYYAGVAVAASFDAAVIFVVKYSNDGADFEGGVLIHSAFTDKPWIAVDRSGGANDGNVYLTFDGRQGVIFTRSIDQGNTFSEPILVKGGSQFSGLTVDPSGKIFVSYLGNFGSGNRISVSKSTDGGLSFSSQVIIAKRVTAPPSPLPGNGFRVFNVPQIASDSGGVYVVWDDFGTGDSDILSVRSLDGGKTWSPPVRVNDIATGQQFFPSIVASAGIVSVVWYDSRLGQLSNGTIRGLDVFYAMSTNAGATFSANIRVTSVSFDPNLVKREDFGDTQVFIGDYIQVAAGPGVVYAIWTDNRNACDTIDPTFGCGDQDAFVARITV